MLHLIKLHNQLVKEQLQTKISSMLLFVIFFAIPAYILIEYKLFALTALTIFLILFGFQAFYKQDINRKGILNNSEFSDNKLAHLFMLFDFFEYKNIAILFFVLLISIIHSILAAFLVLFFSLGFSMLISWYSVITKKKQSKTYRHASMIPIFVMFIAFNTIGNSENSIAARFFFHFLDTKIAQNIELSYFFVFTFCFLIYLLSINYIKRNTKTIKMELPEFTTIEKKGI